MLALKEVLRSTAPISSAIETNTLRKTSRSVELPGLRLGRLFIGERFFHLRRFHLAVCHLDGKRRHGLPPFSGSFFEQPRLAGRPGAKVHVFSRRETLQPGDLRRHAANHPALAAGLGLVTVIAARISPAPGIYDELSMPCRVEPEAKDGSGATLFRNGAPAPA